MKNKITFVQIPQSEAPHGLSIEETLRSLSNLSEKYIRNHKGNELKKPYALSVILTCINGTTLSGELGSVSRDTAEIYPYVIMGGSISGTIYDRVTIVVFTTIVTLEYYFRQRQVDSINLRRKNI
jgi:hypothetical protein